MPLQNETRQPFIVIFCVPLFHPANYTKQRGGWLDTPKGRISVSWRLEDGKMTVEKDVPAGVTVVSDGRARP